MVGEQVSNCINLPRLGARLTLAAVLSSGFAVAAAVPALAAQEPAAPIEAGGQSGRSDADIQSDVAYSLSHSKALQGQHITAATVEGDVTVSGNVHDDGLQGVGGDDHLQGQGRAFGDEQPQRRRRTAGQYRERAAGGCQYNRLNRIRTTTRRSRIWRRLADRTRTSNRLLRRPISRATAHRLLRRQAMIRSIQGSVSLIHNSPMASSRDTDNSRLTVNSNIRSSR